MPSALDDEHLLALRLRPPRPQLAGMWNSGHVEPGPGGSLLLGCGLKCFLSASPFASSRHVRKKLCGLERSHIWPVQGLAGRG